MPNWPLTSRLQHLKSGDQILVSRKPTGTLVLDDLKPGRHLYLLATGTGLAPFLSLIRDPDVYVGHLDAEELQRLVVIGAGDAVRAQQRPPFDRHADHDEVAIAEAQCAVTCRREAEQRLVPVTDVEDGLVGEGNHAATR